MKKVLFLAILCMAFLGCEKKPEITADDIHGQLEVTNTSPNKIIIDVIPHTLNGRAVQQDHLDPVLQSNGVYSTAITYTLVIGTYVVRIYDYNVEIGTEERIVEVKPRKTTYINYPSLVVN